VAPRPNAILFDFFQPGVAILQDVQDPTNQVLQQIPITITYERVVADHFVVAVSPTLRYSLLSSPTLVTSNMFTQLVLELDWHPFDAGLNGFYVGGQVFSQIASSLSVVPSGDGSWSSWVELGLGVAAGYQFVLPLSLVLNVAVGGGAGYGASSTMSSISVATLNGSTSMSFQLTRLELSLGYSF